MDQAISDSQKFHDGFPAVFHRRNQKPWKVTLLLDDFMAIYNNSDYPDI
jgi:hypothetical protein